MPSAAAALALLLAALGALAAFLYPKVEFAGLFRDIVPRNHQQCRQIPGLQFCEDAWIDHDSGLAYLPCSDLSTRQNWLPAVLHLNATSLPAISTDSISLLDLTTLQHRKITLRGLPTEARGIYVHAIDAFKHVNGDEIGKLTFFLNSHRPPKERERAKEVGADSVIELFEGRLGEHEWSYVKTVRHELIRTPNNIVAVGPRRFYFTNDHARKVHWSRKYEALYQEKSDIIYCDASKAEPECKVAVDGLVYPNGIAKGPSNQIYSVSSLAGNIRIWETQGDDTLTLVDEIELKRGTDNVYVSPAGAFYAATFPDMIKMLEVSTPAGWDSGLKSPVEVWKVSNETREDKFYGSKFHLEPIFADMGKTASWATCSAPWKEDKLLIAGVFMENVVLCDIKH